MADLRTSATTPPLSVCVIIAACNAEATIARAIRSALAQSETAEVVVVDDASSDDTAAAAQAADDGSCRLTVLQLETNAGPSAARNLAISRSRAPVIAVLDADDFLLPGRFAALGGIDGWDLLADNIVFISPGEAQHLDPCTLHPGAHQLSRITLADFLRGNLWRPKRSRGELGFAKPLVRRAFLREAGLGYDERLRLGEDYAIYAELLAAGATFLSTSRCGYVAVEQPGSLSRAHQAQDLAALLSFDERFGRRRSLSQDELRALRMHRRQLATKLAYRRTLDLRQHRGRWHALLVALRTPWLLPALAVSLARDKLAARRKPLSSPPRRYLFGG